ncbi:COG3650 family protein [Frigidibacter sp. ROC022]|uniref:COG3650 family protein n=1 Tax=Frigidibacter sp. ROC022 TaxID=2971796 RepID=UPI00215AEAEE|nr:SH3 domain-containing protein [Frigidibacter sp. ROC022]MCR8724420.1 SH3 domain-containing protein [Frigidibacter sp. ROC022]
MRVARQLLLLLVLTLPGLGAARAQDLPAFYDVIGVALDDVLNIRTGPSASSEIIGSLGPTERAVEVVAFSGGGWAQVNTAERSGWVSARFLVPARQWSWRSPETALTCFGTEPFWSLRIDGDMAQLTSPDGTAPLMPILGRGASASRPAFLGLQFDGAVGFIRAEACSDGMSDRNYALSIGLVWFTGGRSLSGCCSLQR